MAIVYDQKFYWNYPTNNDLYFAGVMQSPDSTFIAWGSNSAEPERKWTVGKYLRDGTRVWLNEVTGACQTVFVNTAAEILVSFDDASGIYFRKYSRDNTIIKTAIIGTVTRTPKIIFAAAWNYDNTAVFTGYNKVDSNVERENFWFCKIAEVGNPLSFS
ncbi:MAG: hypothetical protein V4543_09490 [Bacteroidota bacterium]